MVCNLVLVIWNFNYFISVRPELYTSICFVLSALLLMSIFIVPGLSVSPDNLLNTIFKDVDELAKLLISTSGGKLMVSLEESEGL